LAVSSANVSGSPPARTVAQAREQFGEAVGVYLDGGESVDPVASTIVDLTADQPRILREGAVATADIADVLGMPVETLEGKKL
jgi:L-threonylcarbamoyladenylate synthase